MKKNRAMLIIALLAIAAIFLLIYKQTWITQLVYEQQRLTIKRTELKKELEERSRQLYQLKDPQRVYQYATTTLGMKKMSLNQAKAIKQESKQ